MSTNHIDYPDWIFRQSAALPYRLGPDGLQILLITSRKAARWGVPKGIVDPGLTAPETAAKEAWEEAGIEGLMGTQPLGRYRNKKWGGTCTVEVFPMAVTREHADWPESGLRHREWCSVPEALERIGHKKLRKIVRRFTETVDMDTGAHAPSAGAAGNSRVTTWAPKRLIHLLRHAESSREGHDLRDFDRPLAPAGVGALEKMRAYMAFAEFEPDLILCSPARRTRQSLEQILPGFGDDSRIQFDRGLYKLGARGLLNRLRRVPEDISSVMLVGHNPGLHALVLDLVGGGDEKALKEIQKGFPAGALATLILRTGAWARIGTEACDLHSLVVPEQL